MTEPSPSASSNAERKGSLIPRRALIVEDHPVFREGLVQMIRGQEDLAVCGQARDAEEGLEAIGRLKPDVVVVDLSLPGKNGLELIRSVRAQNNAVKLLVVSMHDEAFYADRVLRTGGDGYIMKQEDPDEILHAIRDVLDGRKYVSEEVLKRNPGTLSRLPEAKVRRLEILSDLELEILELLGQGKTDAEISQQLRLAPEKVKAECTDMTDKLGFQRINELLRYAVCWLETGVT